MTTFITDDAVMADREYFSICMSQTGSTTISRRALAVMDALIARLASAEAALKPFWEACSHLHPAIPDDGETLDGFKVSEFRAAADHFAKLKDTDHD